MERESFKKKKHKSPKFKDFNDEDFDWKEKMDLKNIRRRLARKSKRRRNIKEEW